MDKEKPLSVADEEGTEERGFSQSWITVIMIGVIMTIVIASIVFVKMKNAKKVAKAYREERIAELKKKYAFEGNQLIQEHNTRLRILGKDPMRQQKAMQLKQIHDKRIKELHDRYAMLIKQVKNSK